MLTLKIVQIQTTISIYKYWLLYRLDVLDIDSLKVTSRNIAGLCTDVTGGFPLMDKLCPGFRNKLLKNYLGYRFAQSLQYGYQSNAVT